jgi:hypothetical protein
LLRLPLELFDKLFGRPATRQTNDRGGHG